MGDFYILNRAPVIQAESASDAAEAYAKLNGVEAGTILVAGNVKKFDVTVIPATLDVQAKP